MLKSCSLLIQYRQKMLYTCPKQEKTKKIVYEKPKRQPEKTLLLILKCQKCVIKLHHNSVWLSPKLNQIWLIIASTMTTSVFFDKRLFKGVWVELSKSFSGAIQQLVLCGTCLNSICVLRNDPWMCNYCNYMEQQQRLAIIYGQERCNHMSSCCC